MNGFKQTSEPEINLQTIAFAVSDATVDRHFIAIQFNTNQLQHLFKCTGSLIFLYMTYYDQIINGLEIISNPPKGINY